MKESARKADTVLASWGRFVRAGGAIGGLGYPSMTTLARLVCPSRIKLDDNIMEEIDILVGTLDQPFRRVIHRHYVDERKPSGYYPEMRTQEMKASSERMSLSSYKISLHIGRNQLNEKLERL
jgi:hypothetical protein